MIITKNDIVAAVVVPKQLIYWLLKLSLFTIPPDRLKSLHDNVSTLLSLDPPYRT